MYMCTKFQVVLKNDGVLPFCRSHRSTGLGDLSQIWASKNLQDHFSLFIVGMTHASHDPNPKMSISSYLYFVSLDDLGLTCAHEKLGGYLEVAKTRSMSILCNLFRCYAHYTRQRRTSSENWPLR